MNKQVDEITLRNLRELAPNISFPEYQRESTVWNRRARQRLIDSIMREFDIAAFYFYRTAEGELECIDGRQRITTILSFTGDLQDAEDPYFPILIDNEIAPEKRPDLEALTGLNFRDLAAAEAGAAAAALNVFERFKITAVILSDSRDPLEFNLQFTRLNLGTILNSGEKLHAMEGEMHDLCFGLIGTHEFLHGINIPTRRFAVQQVAAQLLSEIFSLEETGDFRRIRHIDLQKFFKQKFKMNADDHRIAKQVVDILSKVSAAFGDRLGLLRNRAYTVSLALLAWAERDRIGRIPAFWAHFMDRLSEQLERVKRLEGVELQYQWLIDFQKDVTQASVEAPAVRRRHEVLLREFDLFERTGKISGEP